MPNRRLFADLYADMLERMTEQSVRWRSMGLLFIAGGALALVSLVLPVAPGTSKAGIAFLGATAIAASVVMHLGAHRLPYRLMSPALALGTTLVTSGVALTGDSSSVYGLLYVWIGFEAFFFLDKRSALGHLTYVAAGYALALHLAGPAGTAADARWLMTVGTVLIIGLLAGALRDRADLLIERLADAARTDPLTGLLNRRGFEERMELELSRARRSGRTAAIIVGDLDHFKMVNDRFGHRAGDELLQRFAQIAGQARRDIDSFGRIGGEEFALVLPDADEHGAFLLAERIRRHLSNDDELGVTCSFGIASFPRHGGDAEALLHCADQALYVAKLLGRNRSVIFSAEVAANVLANRSHGDVRDVEQAAAVLVLAETLDLRDSGTAMHSQTVGRYAEMTAKELGLAPDRVERVRLAGLLHDIGKMGVPDEILRKPGKLTSLEWAEMRKHPELGARILAGANLDDIAGWVLAHHERPDGGGYPSNLPGELIPLEAKILAVADSYEAMTSDRVYQRAMPASQAVAELHRCSGSQFDAGVVEAFLTALDKAETAATV